MFTDPLSVTYNSSAKSLPRVSTRGQSSVYRTADKEFEVNISNFRAARDGRRLVQLELVRLVPDPTPDPFTSGRMVRNSFGVTYGFDADTRAESSVDLPLLRSAVLALVDSTFAGRLITGEI